MSPPSDGALLLRRPVIYLTTSVYLCSFVITAISKNSVSVIGAIVSKQTNSTRHEIQKVTDV
jgi:hypothetical protein